MATTLTGEMRVELASLERAFGPWGRSDADDPEVLLAIVDDLRLYVGMGHQEDMSWLTTGVLAEYIESKVSLVKS